MDVSLMVGVVLHGGWRGRLVDVVRHYVKGLVDNTWEGKGVKRRE
jgi:hypothetical protein